MAAQASEVHANDCLHSTVCKILAAEYLYLPASSQFTILRWSNWSLNSCLTFVWRASVLFYHLSIKNMLLIVLEKYKTYTQHPISYLHIFVKSIEILPRWWVESRSMKGKGEGVGGGHLLKEDGGHWSFWAQLLLPSWPCRLRSAGSGKVDTGHPGGGSKSYMLGRLVNSLMTAASFQTESPNVHYCHSISPCGALRINCMVCFISPLYLLEINSQRISKTCYCLRK